MGIRYTCRHCESEIGTIPFDSVKETVRYLQKLDESEEEQFLVYEKNGDLTVRCICEHCEQSLRNFPSYYSLQKWLQ